MFGRESGKKFAITGKQEEQPATHDLAQPARFYKYITNMRQIGDKCETNTTHIRQEEQQFKQVRFYKYTTYIL